MILIADIKYKPDGVEAAASTSGSSKSAGASNNNATYNMSLDEAHLILNVKKEDPMDAILKVGPYPFIRPSIVLWQGSKLITKNYERIFKANGPPPEPTTTNATATPTPKPAAGGPKRKAPTHSHYLQSKVYRALERIKAERGEDGGSADPTVQAAETLGAAAERMRQETKS